jgi:hypothetical protein
MRSRRASSVGQPLFLVGDELCLPSLALALACLSGVLGTALRQQEGQCGNEDVRLHAKIAAVIDRPHDVFEIGEGAFNVREGR